MDAIMVTLLFFSSRLCLTLPQPRTILHRLTFNSMVYQALSYGARMNGKRVVLGGLDKNVEVRIFSGVFVIPRTAVK